ncbi:hypothetical protein AYO38_02775 [bacterium SCGC AG-212-C10]|nr:hypothetical protein AYO38_02775 [bacterium SCGC AG-212-C10]
MSATIAPCDNRRHPGQITRKPSLTVGLWAAVWESAVRLAGRPSVRRDIRHLQELAAMSAEDKAATAAAARANESGSVVARLRQALGRAS